jgi:hypothetical protein
MAARDLAPASTAHRDAERADQWMPSAAPLPGVGHTSEIVEQAAALVRLQAPGWVPMTGDSGDGR